MALHSGCTPGALGTADSGCHSLKDRSQVNKNVYGFAGGSWPSWRGRQAVLETRSNTSWCAGQGSRLIRTGFLGVTTVFTAG